MPSDKSDKFFKTIHLNDGFQSISDDDWQQIRSLVAADLKAGHQLETYLGNQKLIEAVRNGRLKPEADIPEGGRMPSHLSAPASAYYRKMAAAELMGEVAGDKVRNQLVQRAAFTYAAAELTTGSPDVAHTMSAPVASAVMTYGRKMAGSNKNMKLVADVMAAIDERLPEQFKIASKDPRWFRQPGKETDNLAVFFKHSRADLNDRQTAFMARQKLAEHEPNGGYYSSVFKVAQTAAMAAVLQQRSQPGSKEYKQAKALMKEAGNQIRQMAEVANLQDLGGVKKEDGNRFTNTRQVLNDFAAKFHEKQPAVAQALNQLTDEFDVRYGEFDGKAASWVAKADPDAMVREPMVNSLYKQAAVALKKSPAIAAAADEEGRGGRNQGTGKRPDKDFMRPDRTDEFFDRYRSDDEQEAVNRTRKKRAPTGFVPPSARQAHRGWKPRPQRDDLMPHQQQRLAHWLAVEEAIMGKKFSIGEYDFCASFERQVAASIMKAEIEAARVANRSKGFLGFGF